MRNVPSEPDYTELFAKMNKSHYGKLFKKYKNFLEAQLLEYWSDDLCRDFVVLVCPTWEDGKLIRTNQRGLLPITFRFKQCQRIIIENMFPDHIVKNPDMVNWGLNEFSIIKVEEMGDGLFQFRMPWEGKIRKIEIQCYDLIIEVGDPIELTHEVKEKYGLYTPPGFMDSPDDLGF